MLKADEAERESVVVAREREGARRVRGERDVKVVYGEGQRERVGGRDERERKLSQARVALGDARCAGGEIFVAGVLDDC